MDTSKSSMNRLFRLFLVIGIFILPFSCFAASSECQLLDRSKFETFIIMRMQTYASMGDSWSPRAQKWVNEISKNNTSGHQTPSLDGAYIRFRKYCNQGDDFMASLTLGEWIGIALRAP